MHYRLIPFTLFLAAFAAFLFTMHPTVAPYRDSGDLVVASATLGIAHPPGYPLYILAGKISASVIPWGNAAYRMNALSGLCGALALFVLAAGFRRIFVGDALFPSLSLLLLAFSTSYWRLSQVSEMYSMNALLAALIVVIVAYLDGAGERRHRSLFYLAGFVAGCATGNHQTIVLVFPALAWYLWRAKKFSVAHWSCGALFFALGVSVYAFLPVRSMTEPLSDWGDPETLRSLWRILTRADYGGMRLHPEQSTFHWTAGSVLAHLGVYARALMAEFTVFGAALGVAGIMVKWKDRLFRFLFVSLLLSGPAFVIFSNLPPGAKTTLPILEPHLVLPNLIFAVFIAAGAATAARRFWGRLLVPGAVAAAFLVHLPLADYRQHYFAYDYGRNLLATAEKGSIIYDPDDPTAFVTSYLQVVEGRRPDVKLVTFFRTRWGYEYLKKRYPGLIPEQRIDSGSELARAILEHNISRFPVYAELPGKFPAPYRSYPAGLMYRLSDGGGERLSGAKFPLYRAHRDLAQDDRYDFFTNQVISYDAAARNNLGLAFASNGDHAAARRHYLGALAVDPLLGAAANNLGIVGYARGDYPEAQRWFREVLRLTPGNPSALFNLGLAHKAAGNPDAAGELFRTAWERGSYPDAGNELGLTALNSGRVSEAAGMFRAVISRYPDYRSAYYNLGLALRRSGDNGGSGRFFRMYLDRTADPAERAEVLAILRSLEETSAGSQ